MTIHVVRTGESLWQMAKMYGVSIQGIVDANGLRDIPYLIPGMALLIPSGYVNYVVRPGDTLWLISRQFGVSMADIIKINNIVNPNLIYPGTVLRIPETAGRYGDLEVNGYIQPAGNESDARIVNETGSYLTYLSIFSYRAAEDGTLVPVGDAVALEAANRYGIAPLMVITNFRGGNFDPGLAHTILANGAVQDNLITNVLSAMKAKGYYGLNIDFEHIPPEDRELYNNFVRKVAALLHAEGYQVSAALAPKAYDIKTGPWHGAHDYRAIGEAADFVVLMTYEWGWSGGPPMAVAPINEVEKVVDYAVSVIPSHKVVMGIPLYGYDWTLPYVPGGRWTRQVSPQGAVELAVRTGAVINYDETAQAPYFNYVDKSGASHVVWFEDARSVLAKFMLVSRKRLRGVSYWVLGQPFPQNWLLLQDMFRIVRAG